MSTRTAAADRCRTSTRQKRCDDHLCPNLLDGWGKRPYDWETQAGIQHEYGDRLNQLDGRLSKTFKFGSRGRAQVMFDLYNLLNVGPVLVLNTTYGAAWQTPTAILPGRLAKFGARIDF